MPRLLMIELVVIAALLYLPSNSISTNDEGNESEHEDREFSEDLRPPILRCCRCVPGCSAAECERCNEEYQPGVTGEENSNSTKIESAKISPSQFDSSMLAYILSPLIAAVALVTKRKKNRRTSGGNTQKQTTSNTADSSRITCGVLEQEGRYKMLLHCGRKAKAMGDPGYGKTILQEYRKFTGDESIVGRRTFKEVCHEVAERISAERWMRFVRLHLNLNEDEIDDIRERYCVVTEEQVRQIRYWTARSNNLHRMLIEESRG